MAVKRVISFLIRFVPRKYLQSVSGVFMKLAHWFLRGSQTECVVCGNHYRHFLPYGRLRARSNALCPGCLSLERHRLIQLFLTRKTEFFKKQLKVLHIAPERCFLESFKKQHGSGYVTADLESPWADVKLDIHHMPFTEAQFDVVLCNHVLEHVKDDIQAMTEIKRVLKKGGWAILQVPFFSPVPEHTFSDDSITDSRERERIFGQNDHIRRYGRDYPVRISQSGLRVREEIFSFDLTKEECHRYGLVPEIIYIGIKE